MKSKVIVIALILCILAVTVTGTTIAYFTDTKTQTNVFTTGEVKIRFTENGAEITDPSVRIDHGRVYPGMAVQKNSEMQNVGTDAAYFATKIRITDGDGDIRRALVYPWVTPTGNQVSVTALFGGDLFTGLAPVADRAGYYENADYLVYFDTTVSEGFLIYVYVKDVQQKGDAVSLLESITFPAQWDHEQLNECRQLEIEQKVFATQAVGFTDCEQAMAASFEDEF